MWKRLLFLIAGAWLAVFAFVGVLDVYLNWGKTRSRTQEQYVSLRAKPDLPMVFPDFKMLDQSGRKISRDELKGQVWVASFVYAQCDSICPTLNRVMSQLAQDSRTGLVRFVSFSADPTDDAAKLLRYQQQYPDLPPQRWHVIQADTQNLPRIAYQLKILSDPAVMNQGYYPASENLYLVDPQGVIVGVYNGFDPVEVNLFRNETIRLCTMPSTPQKYNTPDPRFKVTN